MGAGRWLSREVRENPKVMQFIAQLLHGAQVQMSSAYVTFNPANCHERQATWSEATPEGRWRSYTYNQLAARDKVNLDIFWLRDESLEDSTTLPDPDILAAEIIEDLQAALAQFSLILGESEV